MNIILKPQNYSPLTKNSHCQLLPESSCPWDGAGEVLVLAQEPCKHSCREHSLQAACPGKPNPPFNTHSPSGLIPLASSASQVLNCRVLGALWPFPGHGGGDYQHISPAHRWADPTILQQDHVPLPANQQSAVINENQLMGVISPNSTSAFLHSHHSQACVKAVKTHFTFASFTIHSITVGFSLSLRKFLWKKTVWNCLRALFTKISIIKYKAPTSLWAALEEVKQKLT